jgi:hypothetical protein
MIPKPTIMRVSLLKDFPIHESWLTRAGHIITAWARAVAIRLLTIRLLARRALRREWGRRVRHVALMVSTAVSHGLLNARDHFVLEVMPLLVLLLMGTLLFGRFLMAWELSVNYINIVLLYFCVISIDIGWTMLRYIGVLELLLTIKELLLLLLEEMEVRI